MSNFTCKVKQWFIVQLKDRFCLCFFFKFWEGQKFFVWKLLRNRSDLVRHIEQRMIQQCQFYYTFLPITTDLTNFISFTFVCLVNNVVNTKIWLNLFGLDSDNQSEPSFRMVVNHDVKQRNSHWSWCFHHIVKPKVYLFTLLFIEELFLSDPNPELAPRTPSFLPTHPSFLQARFTGVIGISGLLPTWYTISIKSIHITVNNSLTAWNSDHTFLLLSLSCRQYILKLRDMLEISPHSLCLWCVHYRTTANLTFHATHTHERHWPDLIQWRCLRNTQCSITQPIVLLSTPEVAVILQTVAWGIPQQPVC